jgi:hypothetical protein
MFLAYRVNPSFFAAGSQEEYLEHTHFQPFYDQFEKVTGIDLRERPLAVQNAA